MTEPCFPHSNNEDRVDLREEWYGFDRDYLNIPPKIYWVGMVLSAFWVLGYLLIYPSIPLVSSQTHWQGLGVPGGGCQPWTAICEMQQAEEVLSAVRGKYLNKIRLTSVEDLAEDISMVDFVTRAGLVHFGDNCAGCHGKLGAGIAKLHDLAPALNDAVWLHGGDVQSIKASILNPSTHPFVLIKRIDDPTAKMLAVYVYGLLNIRNNSAPDAL